MKLKTVSSCENLNVTFYRFHLLISCVPVLFLPSASPVPVKHQKYKHLINRQQKHTVAFSFLQRCDQAKLVHVRGMFLY